MKTTQVYRAVRCASTVAPCAWRVPLPFVFCIARACRFVHSRKRDLRRHDSHTNVSLSFLALFCRSLFSLSFLAILLSCSLAHSLSRSLSLFPSAFVCLFVCVFRCRTISPKWISPRPTMSFRGFVFLSLLRIRKYLVIQVSDSNDNQSTTVLQTMPILY
jgi:hypothetical protein